MAVFGLRRRATSPGSEHVQKAHIGVDDIYFQCRRHVRTLSSWSPAEVPRNEVAVPFFVDFRDRHFGFDIFCRNGRVATAGGRYGCGRYGANGRLLHFSTMRGDSLQMRFPARQRGIAELRKGVRPQFGFFPVSRIFPVRRVRACPGEGGRSRHGGTGKFSRRLAYRPGSGYRGRGRSRRRFRSSEHRSSRHPAGRRYRGKFPMRE